MTPSLPGSLPGLLRVGSPVVRRIDKGTAWAAHYDGVVFGVNGDTCGVIDLDGEVVGVPLSDVVLDLTDPTGRIHALWWAIANEELLGGLGRPLLGLYPCIEMGADLSACDVLALEKYFRDRLGIPSV